MYNVAQVFCCFYYCGEAISRVVIWEGWFLLGIPVVGIRCLRGFFGSKTWQQVLVFYFFVSFTPGVIESAHLSKILEGIECLGPFLEQIGP